MNWSARPLRRARLFTSLLIVGAASAVTYSCWPWFAGSVMAQALAILILLLVAARAGTLLWHFDALNNNVPHSLSRIAAGHWRLSTPGRAIDGNVHHIWRGWAWITLQIQPFDRSGVRSVTVWRAHVSDADWHLLRVWTSWEIAMVDAEPQS